MLLCVVYLLLHILKGFVMKNNLNIFSNLKAELLGVVLLSMLMTSGNIYHTVLY